MKTCWPIFNAACLVMVINLNTTASAWAVDYYWTSASGGAFDEPTNWTPFTPPATQGPGGVNDTVNFDLGVPSFTPYFVTDMGRENSRLIVHNDSLLISVFVHHELSSPDGANPSFVVGASSGDDGFVSLFGGGVSVLDTRVVRIANAAGSEGSVRIDALEWNSDNFRVGHAGDGTLAMDIDATLNSTNASIAHLTGSTGRATVQGDWNIAGNFIVGRQGEASLEVSAGGSLVGNSIVIGDQATGLGVAFVSAAMTATDSLTIGDSGNGTLIVTGSFGNVTSTSAFVGRQAGSRGVVAVGNNGIWSINGRLSIGGDSAASSVGGDGLVEITGGAVAATHDITIFPDGQISLVGGTLDAPIIDAQSGAIFDWAGGQLTVDTFNGNLSNFGGVLAARAGSNSILVSGEYSQGPFGLLKIGIDGPAASHQFDSVIVGNTAFLGGILHVELAEGFQPEPDEVYVVMDALNLGAGSFSNAANGERLFLDQSAGSFLLNYGASSPFDPSQVVLSDFQPATNGDFDGDGDADGRDFLLWQRGESPSPLSAGDLADWQGNYGVALSALLGGPPAAEFSVDGASPVPEPNSTVLLILLTLSSCWRSIPSRHNSQERREFGRWQLRRNSHSCPWT